MAKFSGTKASLSDRSYLYHVYGNDLREHLGKRRKCTYGVPYILSKQASQNVIMELVRDEPYTLVMI